MMSRVRRKDTAPELIVRRVLHRLGYRYRLHAKELPGSPDVVFRPRKAAIFVHGCFWHGHECRRSRPAKSNVPYWLAKIARNRARDAAAESGREERGGRVLTVWECENGDPDTLAGRLRSFLDSPKPAA